MCTALQRGKRSWVVLITPILLWIGLGPSLAQKEEVTAAGKQEYQRYCRTCHGETGKGDGIMARYLTVTPADLTQLLTKYGGRFTYWDVYATID